MSKICNSCNGKVQATIPYAAHEADMARAERASKRLWVVIIVLIVALIISNLAWVVYESQFECVDINQSVEQDASENGNNTFVGGDYYGTSTDTYSH